MIELFYCQSSNAQKVLIFLEEVGIPFEIRRIDVTAGEQFAPDFVAIAPNSKIPVITDHAPADGGPPITVFESGAILQYLAEKTRRFLACDVRGRAATMQWLFWQMAGLGPIGGQAVHFRNFAPEEIPYALARYGKENDRLIAVLDRQLAGRDFIVGDYSIADMACYPWIVAHERRGQIDFTPYPHLLRWFEAIKGRPATDRAYAWLVKLYGTLPKGHGDMSNDARRIMFGDHAVPKPA